jgi:chitinase
MLLVSGLLLLSFSARADLWSTAYYAVWLQGTMPPSKVDYTAVTHIIHFAIVPNSNGTLDTTANGMTPKYSTNLVAVAHAAGKKVLYSIGGAGSLAGFQGAASSANRATFINNLINFMTTYNYDGIDLDWEPISNSDINAFTNLVNNLRPAMTTARPQSLLTAAMASQPAMFASLQSKFDQINIMTYDISGPWDGWVTWFNSPIYNGGYRFASTGGLVPSIDGIVNSYIAAGIAPGKLGIGIPFYGYVWKGGAGTTNGGVTYPRQSWTNAPTASQYSYDDIMTQFYQPQRYSYDADAQCSYLSINNTGSTNDMFISYDDEHACQAKVSYARNRGLGGIMIFDLGEGYRPSQPAGQRDPLLQAVKQALAPTRITSIVRSNQDIRLSFASMPLASYRIQSNTNLAGGIWNTVTNNVTGIGGTMQITDPATFTQPRRFYRIQTPP